MVRPAQVHPFPQAVGQDANRLVPDRLDFEEVYDLLDLPALLNFLLPGLVDSSLRLTALSVGRQVSEISGGTLAAELRATRLHADDGTTENVFAAGLRWTRKF